MSFREKWLEAVDKKDSVLCAGLDPADFKMGRGEKGLPEGVNRRDWALGFIRAVAPYCAAVKPNIQYWKDEGDMESLMVVSAIAEECGLLVIDDSKLADIADTNDAGFFYAGRRPVDAVTFSPFAGNIAEAAKQGHDRGVGVISMCLMSNPEYDREKKKLVNVWDCVGQYDENDIIYLRDEETGYDGFFVHQYVHLARQAELCGIDGIVIGAPSSKNHITEEELATARRQVSDRMLVLLPGVGAQGGEAEAIWKYFAKGAVIVNVGRDLMFPGNNNAAGPEEHAARAKHYMERLNELRAA
ncbi:MAG: orotidine 5'-phosphate decarboxylase [Nanoarchaeota archaeon]|nr:orotidine 5'-phosphate decarboxylase [Nanoarchaeota archaeon]